MTHATEQYRVRIAGPDFSVNYATGPMEDDLKPDYIYLASCAIAGALAMASYGLPRVTQILAHVVINCVQSERCDIDTVRNAEMEFVEAAKRLVDAWEHYSRSTR